MKRWFLILVTLATIAAAESAKAQEAPDPWMTRISARHMAGEGVGHTTSYSSLDWFVPLLPAESDSTIWFGDIRGLIFNDAEFGSNVGTGYRWFVEDQNRIYGINGYWDTRNDNSLLFNQAGIGVESLGQIFDFRANGYTPAVDADYQYQLGNAYFQDNRLFVPATAALSGLDAEAGVNLPSLHQISSSVFGGGYYYDSNRTIAAAGWRVRAEATFRDFVVVGVSVQDDELFGQTVNGMIEVRHTVFHHSTLARRSMRHKFRDADGSRYGQTVRHRLADPVYRRENIVLKEESARPATLSGAPLNFVHVVPGGAGDGTFENPYGTISTAMLDPLAGSGVIYTPAGGTFTENVTMTPGSTLFSNGPTQFVNSDFGSVRLPLSGANGSLSALPSTIVGDVTLANDSVLNGFDVQGGVSGTNVLGVSLANNRIASSPGNAISLTTSSDVSMDNLLIANPAGRGILLTTATASMSSVTIQNSGSTALELDTSVGVSMNNMSITNPADRGILMNNSAANMSSVTIRNSGSTALELNTSAGASIDNLVIANPAGRGILLNDSSANMSSVTIQNSGNTAFEINTTNVGGIVAASGLNITNTAGSIRGIDANVTGTGNLLLGLSAIPGAAPASNSISVKEDAVNVSTSAGSTGNAVVLLNTLAVSSSSGAGIVLDGSAGAGTMWVSSLAGNSVTEAATGGALFNTVTFDSNPLTPAIEQVSAGILSVGAVPDNVKGAGLSIQNSTGDLNLGVTRIFNNNGPGLFVASSPTLTVSSTLGSTIETQSGAVLDLSNTKSALNFLSLKSEHSPGVEHGIHLNNVTGTITSTSTSIVDSNAPTAILIENIPAASDSLVPKFGTLTIESLFDNTEATNISLPGVNTGITQPIYTAPLRIEGP
ncbi:MAG: inverse autotransporter beta domain-containing protein [Planctomycetaceae bacterium]